MKKLAHGTCPNFSEKKNEIVLKLMKRKKCKRYMDVINELQNLFLLCDARKTLFIKITSKNFVEVDVQKNYKSKC